MGWIKDLKSNIETAAGADTSLKVIDTIDCKLERGENHIFTKYFTLNKTEDGEIYVNKKHKVKIITCSECNETQIVKSTGKKLGGAAVGGLLTGGFGAVVGAMVVGNNKKETSKLNRLVVQDENDLIHEVIIHDSFLFKTRLKNGFL